MPDIRTFLINLFSPQQVPADSTSFGFGADLSRPKKKKYLHIQNQERLGHTLVLGTTGSGKSVLATNIIEQDILTGKNVVYFDSKGDKWAFSKIFAVCRKAGRLGDLVFASSVYPDLSADMNPLVGCESFDEIADRIISIMQAEFPFCSARETKDLLISILSSHFFGQTVPPEITINDIRLMFDWTNIKKIDKELRLLNTPDSLALSSKLLNITGWNPQFCEHVLSPLVSCLNSLCSGYMGALMGHSSENLMLEKLQAKESLILIIHDPRYARPTGVSFGKSVLAILQDFLSRQIPEYQERHLFLHIDDAHSFLYPGSEQMFSLGRNMQAAITIYSQTIAQIQQVIGDASSTILGNTNTKIFLRSADYSTAEYASNYFGTDTGYMAYFAQGTMLFKKTNSPMVCPAAFLDMHQYSFYMSTLNGHYKGRVLRVQTEAQLVIFPDDQIPSFARIGRYSMEDISYIWKKCFDIVPISQLSKYWRSMEEADGSSPPA